MRLLPVLLLVACDAATDSADPDTGGDTGLVPGEVRVGAFCPLTTRLGQLSVWRQDEVAYLDGQVFDRPTPFFGEPSLTTSTCAYHEFDPAVCGQCDEGKVCARTGECVDMPQAHLDLSVDVTTAEGTKTFVGDTERGLVYGSAGPVDAAYTLAVSFAGELIEVPEQSLPAADLQVDITTEGDSMAPGALDATWAPGPEGTVVRSIIPINHHAAGPTFTSCAADASAGAFHADAEMIDPLAVVTGLEFQGLDHGVVVAAQVSAGCVELFYGGHAPFELNGG